MRRFWFCLVALSVCGGKAFAGDFVDTRLSFNIGDENLLVKPGETQPSVPGVHAGQPNSLGILFFDNYDTRYTGYENLSHLAVYKQFGNSRLTAEGALVLRFLQFTDVNLSSIDDGSYMRFQLWFDRNHAQEGGRKGNLALTVFPLNSDRMRLGYSYRISWGGSPILFKYNPDLPTGSAAFITNTNPAPGAKLQLSDERYYVYIGFKTTQLLDRNPNVNQQVSVWSALGGVGGDVVPNHLRLEANGGYFDRGTNQLFFGTSVGPTQGVQVHEVVTYGGSVQLSAFSGISPSQSIDFALYRNDPMVSAARYFQPYAYKPGFNWLASTEWTFIGSTLQNPDKPNSTDTQFAFAGDVNLRAQVGHLRIRADFELRSLEFILLNQPGLVPYQDFSKGSTVKPELFGVVGVDYNFERIGLTIGPSLGLQRSASFTPPAGKALPSQLCGNTGNSICNVGESGSVVIRNQGDVSILPYGATDVPVVAAKVEAREDFLQYFAVIAQVFYEYDGNYTHLTKAVDGSSLRSFNSPNELGFNLTLQARF